MSKINKLTSSFIIIANALDKVHNQDEYNICVSMLDDEELECLKYAQRLRKYTNRQLFASPTDTDKSKPEQKKRGRKKKGGSDDVIMSDPTTPEEEPNPPPSPFLSHGNVACKSVLVYF
ncbi:MAG: hypothetical protein ACKPKO_14575 [Candidatus Fonsibacter sp.]